MNENPAPVSPAAEPAHFQRDLVALIPHLRAFSRGLCGRQAIAEDMAQEALVKAWRARGSFAAGTNMKAWLFTILRNEFYSHTRRSWRETHWDTGLGECIAAPALEQEWTMQLSDTARALRALPDSQREALILISAGGLSYEEAGEICGIPVGTVKSRVARGRTALLKIVDGNASASTSMPPRIADGSSDILAQLSALTRPGAHRAGTHA